MTDPTFVLSRHNYYHERSYADYLRLIELSGYSTCYFDEMDIHDPARCYLVSPYGPDWGGWPGARARIIWWDLEWREARVDVPGISEIWVSDSGYAQQLGAKYVPLGSHPGLKLDTGWTGGKIYDVALLAYMTNRRQQIANDLRAAGVTLAPNGWNEARHAALCQSTAMLHVHQLDGYRTVAPQRFALAAAYRLPLITESIDDTGIFGHSHLLMSDYANLPRFVKMWTQRNDRHILEDYGHSLYQLLCVWKTFRVNVEAAL